MARGMAVNMVFAVGLLMAVAGGSSQAAGPKVAAEPIYDLLLTNGRVVDPANNLDAIRDVAIAGGKIAAVAPRIPAASARRVVDVRGYFVTPGFIDLHAHGGPAGTNRPAHPPDICLSSGVTTFVDAGSWGARDFPAFRKNFIDRASIRILAFLNIVATGMADEAQEQDVTLMDATLCADTIAANRDVIVGVKVAHYWTSKPWDSQHPPWAAVDRALDAGRRAKLPIMVDFWPRPPERSYADMLARLRPGDIHTHVFAQQFPVLDANHKVQEYMRKERARGVLFDLGHGAGSFWFRNAAPAIAQGFWPDTISTDLHHGNVNGPVVDLITTMSKILALGVPLPEVIRRVTVNPARAIARPDLGTLTVGSEADVAVFEQRRGRFGFSDSGRAKITASSRLENRLTVRAGRVAYDPQGLAMPEWKKAPAQYFKVPALQTDAPSTADPLELRRWQDKNQRAR